MITDKNKILVAAERVIDSCTANPLEYSNLTGVSKKLMHTAIVSNKVCSIVDRTLEEYYLYGELEFEGKLHRDKIPPFKTLCLWSQFHEDYCNQSMKQFGDYENVDFHEVLRLAYVMWAEDIIKKVTDKVMSFCS